MILDYDKRNLGWLRHILITLKQMLTANFVGAYSIGKAEIEKMETAKKASFDLGRQMVQIAEKKFEHPKGFNTNFFAFGTHTH